jgi:hypothetical protein
VLQIGFLSGGNKYMDQAKQRGSAAEHNIRMGLAITATLWDRRWAAGRDPRMREAPAAP